MIFSLSPYLTKHSNNSMIILRFQSILNTLILYTNLNTKDSYWPHGLGDCHGSELSMCGMREPRTRQGRIIILYKKSVGIGAARKNAGPRVEPTASPGSVISD